MLQRKNSPFRLVVHLLLRLDLSWTLLSILIPSPKYSGKQTLYSAYFLKYTNVSFTPYIGGHVIAKLKLVSWISWSTPQAHKVCGYREIKLNRGCIYWCVNRYNIRAYYHTDFMFAIYITQKDIYKTGMFILHGCFFQSRLRN